VKDKGAAVGKGHEFVFGGADRKGNIKETEESRGKDGFHKSPFVRYAAYKAVALKI
jgi:hypothetical protein